MQSVVELTRRTNYGSISVHIVFYWILILNYGLHVLHAHVELPSWWLVILNRVLISLRVKR
jgi:hypothetical protein